MHTHHIHNINSHMIALVIRNLISVVSLQFGLYLSLCLTASSYKWTSCIYLLIVESVIPSVSGPEMSLIISPVDSGAFFVKPSGFWRTRVKCLSKAEWILANLLSKAEWILANVYQKPSGFSQTFYQKPSGFSQMFIKSQVDSRKPFIKSRVDSRKCFTKPSGFSQMFYQAEWILANLVLSPADSGETFYEAEWIPGKLS